MRPDHTFHNPFCNRFHDPVHRRHEVIDSDADEPNAAENARDKFSGLFALVVLAISFALMLRAF